MIGSAVIRSGAGEACATGVHFGLGRFGEGRGNLFGGNEDIGATSHMCQPAIHAWAEIAQKLESKRDLKINPGVPSTGLDEDG